MSNVDNKDIRGRILKTLNNQYPSAMSVKMLSYGLRAASYKCSGPELKAHLAYLEGKGYIEIKKVGVQELELERKMIELTVTGKDLVEGNIEPDPGVLLL